MGAAPCSSRQTPSPRATGRVNPWQPRDGCSAAALGASDFRMPACPASLHRWKPADTKLLAESLLPKPRACTPVHSELRGSPVSDSAVKCCGRLAQTALPSARHRNRRRLAGRLHCKAPHSRRNCARTWCRWCLGACRGAALQSGIASGPWSGGASPRHSIVASQPSR